MVVMLIGGKIIHKIILPHVKTGNYWISDKNGENEKKLISINGKDGKWQIESNNNVKIIDRKFLSENNSNYKKVLKNWRIIDKIDLAEYEMHEIYFEKTKEFFVLYCLPTYDDQFLQLKIKDKKEIYIGKDLDNDISYSNDFIANKHARIFFYNGKWRIENLDSKFGTFVNNRIVEVREKILFNGDIVFIMGLKIIVIGDRLFINNPNNKLKYNEERFLLNNKKSHVILYKEDEEEDEELKLYQEKDYFSRAPRITNIIECEKVKIDSPPQIQDKEEMPLILMLGSSLAMGSMMMISMITAIDGYMAGTATTKQTIFSLVSAGMMLIAMIIFPILTAKYHRKKKKRYEEKRQKRYKEYLNSKKETINNIMNKQRNILYENHVSPEECTKILLFKNARLWERKIDDADFLTVRLGIGDIPLDIDIQYPEENFTMEDDNLLEILNDIANNSKVLKSAPIVTSLVEKNISAIIAQDNFKVKRFLQSLIIQLITFQSYEDLKLVFLLKEDQFKNWDFVKMLPHLWNDTKQIRFFANNYEDMKEISKYLEEDMQVRQEHDNKDKDYKLFMPYYLIITDDYKNVKNLKIIREILKAKTNLGFSILFITNDLMQLPNECKTFISLDEKQGMIFENEISSVTQKQFDFDTSVILFWEKICKEISNIPIKYIASSKNILPNNYNFLEMYDVGRIEQLNILERWRKNDSTLSLKAPIGIDSTGNIIWLDVHEKFHGPHGLIAGTTGSGKSEFIITYILSLAINYHPDDVNFILIDYKGGGLAGAFQKREIKLPHLVGTITNIDTYGLKRSLASIQSELRKRQIIFNEVRNMTEEGTIDIYKYQKLYHEKMVTTPIPHLFIICDEFAELKQQEPEFMEELMSVSRIGRSLGIHLILATQKPAGIVNDQIRSNSKFAICLKVQDKADSNDVIKKPDAANLKRAGQFYMLVGNDEYFVLGQSAWSGASYFPADVMKKNIDTSLQFVTDLGTTMKKVDDLVQNKISDEGEQLTNILKYLYRIAGQEKITTKKLWLDNIPETIFIEDLIEKYKFKAQKHYINPVIGEYDDPFNQKQGLVNLNLSEEGNTIIYGNAESGKETLLSTMVYGLITQYNSQEVQLYLLDFGSEALKIYKNSPQVGDVLFINDTEKISRFFKMIQKEIKQRKEILSDYNGDYKFFLKTSGKSMPMIVVTINGFETFLENFEHDYDDIFLSITRDGVKCGIVFVITVSAHNDIRYRISQNFKQKIALQLNKEDDYLNIFEKVGKKRPANMFGRGLITLENGNVFEFQTAKICEPEDYNNYIREVIEKIKDKNTTIARPIPVMPNKVSLEEVKNYLTDISNVPIGITKKDLLVYNYNFKRNFINIITSTNITSSAQFAIHLLEELRNLKDINLIVFDAERILESTSNNIKEQYVDFINNYDKNGKRTICVIIGLDKFLSNFDSLGKEFGDSLKQLEESRNCNYILVESANKLKSYEFSEWFKAYAAKDNGVWVGNGIDNQYLLTINSSRRDIINNCGLNYGYVVKQGIVVLIKLLEMKGNGDEDG